MYPSYEEIAEALLHHIYIHGGPEFQVRANTTYAPLAEQFNLSRQERTQTRDEAYGDGREEPVWNNMVQWARNSLKRTGDLAPSRYGYWRLSAKALARFGENHS